jgi:hypothetical protein
MAGCAPAATPPEEAKLPFGAHLLSAASQRAAWCHGERRVCEDFSTAPVREIVRFEKQFPAILKAQGYSSEAELLHDYSRAYWAVIREGRLYIRGTLVCRDRLSNDGSVRLLPSCPLFEVTFPAGYPQRVEFLVY